VIVKDGASRTDRGDPAAASCSARIGSRGLVVFYVTNLVGAGILIVPGLAGQIAGPASLLSWAVLVLLSFPVARLFADVSARRPESGAISAMIKVGLGRTAGQTATVLLVAAFVLFNPVMGIASARYACDLLGLSASWTMPVAGGHANPSRAGPRPPRP
jgi:amino acid efflux transporter